MLNLKVVVTGCEVGRQRKPRSVTLKLAKAPTSCACALRGRREFVLVSTFKRNLHAQLGRRVGVNFALALGAENALLGARGEEASAMTVVNLLFQWSVANTRLV